MKTTLIAPLVVVFCLATSVSATVPSGLVHHWNFDEGPDWHDSAFGSVCTNTTALDPVNGATASLQNMSSSNWVSGRQFTGLEFDGVNEHLLVATNLASTLGDTASLSFWLRTTQTGAVSAATAPGVAGVAGGGAAQWGWLDNAGRIGLAVDNTLVARSTNSISDGRWHHVVLTRDSGSGAGQVYVDGVLENAGAGASGARAAGFTSLGRIENGGSPAYLQGRLDQVHVFNRVISGGEVAMLRTNHAPKCWDISTEGVNDRPFTTASIHARTYDVERDTVSVWSWTQPAHGSVTHNGDGSFTYAATGGYLGGDSFAVTVEDGKGGFHTANLKVTVMSEPPGGGGVPVTQFTDFAAIQAGGANISHSGIRVPRVIDWNNDGKLDLLIGAGGYVWLYVNNGTTNAPSFAAGVKVQAAGADIYAGSTSSSPITLADMTGDGVRDLVMTDSGNKLRVYRNTSASNATPVYAAYVAVKHTNGTDFVTADRRFDLGDWNGDGKPDLVTGTFSGSVQLFLNSGTASDPRYSTGTALFSDSYQLYPRLFDLNGNGLTDLLRGINWGNVVYWRDAGSLGLVNSTTLTITYTDGTSPAMQSLTDGPVVDFGDYNGDGKLDLVVGGQGGAAGNLFITRGVRKSIAESLAEIEAIYNIDTNNVGVTLSANTNALLNAVNSANWNLISHLQNGTLGTREALFAALTNHIAKYGFLKYQALNTNNYHHVPSIVLQNWVMLEYTLADTPTQRTNIANVMGLSGTMRTIFLETGLAVGDNGQSLAATYGTIRDFQRRHPRELFPDAILTTDQLYGDGRGGFVWTPNSTKNTFGQWALGSANEWAGDLTTAIEKVLGAGAASGEYFTFVMGHEVSHSLDGYVNARANADLRKRWGLMLCTAAGPDVIPGTSGWRDVTATKSNFLAKGYWDGVEANWSAAWSNYWAVGVGAPFRDLSFMRGNIDWFLDASQESLATQANHHWANGPGRLIGAVDRFRRASGAGLGPLKANINEAATFIDYLSAGMNRVNLVETKYQASPQQVNWIEHYAELERDDRGYIRRITVDGRIYDFDIHTNGVVTNVTTSLLAPVNDAVWTFRDQPRQFNILANDSRLEGGSVQLAGVTQPAHGTVSTNVDGSVIYSPTPGYVGNDSFTYSVTSSAGGTAGATAFIEVVNTNTPAGPVLVEYWHSISGSAVTDLTGNANFPANPSVKYYTNSLFELRSSYGDNYGSRVRTQFIAPVAGNYTFWIASDDGGELWFSPGMNEAGKTLIAYETSWAASRQWTKYASQMSAPVALAAGQACYMETLQKEGGGGDNLAVAWMGPAPYNTTNVIGTTYLRQPFGGFGVPRFNSDPLQKPDATPNQAYASSLSGDVTDTNANETLTFVKLGGPAWLGVAANGALSGTPSSGDLGTNTFTVRVTDSAGFADDAQVRILVGDPTSPPTITSQPQSVATHVNSNATFSVTAGGTPAPGYQWRFNGAGISGANGTSYTITAAQTTNEGAYTVVVTNTAGAVTSSVASLTLHREFGRAPAPYPSLLADDGARHLVVPGLRLGATNVISTDARTNALGDDGVQFTTALQPGQSATLKVVASAAGWLNGWIDFSANGSWADAGEQVLVNTAVAGGTNTLNINVPATATVTPATWARFRFSLETNLATTGLSANGEVEDYPVAIAGFTLTYNAAAGGSISGTTPQTVNYGAAGTAVTAAPNTGYHFVNWSDGSAANPRTDVNVTNNISVTANFAINSYTLTYNAGANGTISGTTPQTVNHGGSGTPVTAVPNSGYMFVNWSDGSAANPRTDANVTNNITVTANFGSLPGGLPAPWTTNKIGTITAAVAATHNAGTFYVTGGGSTIGGKNDNLWFVNQAWSGNATLTARVASQQNTGSSAKAGVMIRETTATGSRSVFMGLTPTSGAQWIRRSNTGGNSSTTTAAGIAAPYWVRLTRNGNTFTGYISSNNTTWTQVASASVSMASSVRLGLAVCSGSSSTTNLSIFDSVSVTNAVLAMAPPEEPPSGSPVAMFGTPALETDAVSFEVIGTPDSHWQLEASVDGKNWTPIQSLSLIGGSIHHSEADERVTLRLLRLRAIP